MSKGMLDFMVEYLASSKVTMEAFEGETLALLANKYSGEGHDTLWQCVNLLFRLSKCLQDRIVELEAIKERLPKTADGVSVVPGEDTVWDWRMRNGPGTETWVECAVEIPQPYAEINYDYVAPNDVGGCYSTLEAAKAAKEKNDG